MRKVVLAIALMLSACQQQPQSVELLSEPVVSEQAGLELTISSLIVDPDIVSIELKVANASDRPIPFYPDQGAAIVDGLQIDASNVYTEGDVSGDLEIGAAKEGIIYYPVVGDAIAPDEIKQIRLNMGSVIPANITQEPEQVVVEINR